jgi:crotonobetainyl-CoA:carnitine CoA-transferase CaiB-like acyl-CoA transferase
VLRVIELAGGLASQFATMALAELGADVIKVEPPDGDRLRARREVAPDDFSFEYLNRRKRSVALDLESNEGRATLLELVASADAVVEDLDAKTVRRLRLSFRTLRRARPEIVVTSISSFGRSGPRAGWQANDFVLQAMGGVVAGTGWEDQPPQRIPGSPASFSAGLQAAALTSGAVYGVRAGEEGVHIDVSIQEAMSTHWTREIERYVYHGLGVSRGNVEMGLQGFPHTVMANDGYLYLLALRAEWEPLGHFLGLDDFITHEWSDPRTRLDRWDEISPQFTANIAARSKYDWFADAAAQGYTFAPVDDMSEVQRSPQLLTRDFFSETDIEGESVTTPGLPFTFAATPPRPNVVPGIGEHTAEVLAELRGS